MPERSSCSTVISRLPLGEVKVHLEGLGLDSLDAVELVVLIQKHFNVQIKDMEDGKKAFLSINALAKYITDKR